MFVTRELVAQRVRRHLGDDHPQLAFATDVAMVAAGLQKESVGGHSDPRAGEAVTIRPDKEACA